MRVNEVFLYGQVMKEPTVYCKDRDRTKPLKAQLVIRVVRRVGGIGDQLKLKWDYIIVSSRNPEIISRDILHPDLKREEDDIRKFDIVTVRGTISTWTAKRPEPCNLCGKINKVDRAIAYVDPISIHISERNLSSKEEGTATLRECYEQSNYVMAGGWITSDPEYYREDKYKVLSFGMRSKRIRNIPEDGAEKKADAPWIRVYGHHVDLYREMYQKDSEVLIVGSIQNRRHEIKCKCDFCKEERTYTLDSIELVPYRIEPGRNCKIPSSEDIEDAVLYDHIGLADEDLDEINVMSEEEKEHVGDQEWGVI